MNTDSYTDEMSDTIY